MPPETAPTTKIAASRATSLGRQMLLGGFLVVGLSLFAALGPAMFQGGSTVGDRSLASILGVSCASAEGTAHVGLVIDYDGLNADGAPGAPVRVCVSVSDGGNGFEALQSGSHGVRVNSAGLLCAIDGYPGGTECGERLPDGRYRYWAYFHGGASWTYQGIGPAATRLHDGSVEGWHFVVGAGNPTDPAPNSSSASSCPAPISPTVPVAPVTNSPTGPTAVTPTTPSPGLTVGGSPNPTDPRTTVGPSLDTQSGIKPGESGSAPATNVDPHGGAIETGAASPGSSPGPGTDDDSGNGASKTGASTSGSNESGVLRDDLNATVASSRSSAPGVPIAAVIVVIVVALLGGTAAFRFRAERNQ